MSIIRKGKIERMAAREQAMQAYLAIKLQRDQAIANSLNEEGEALIQLCQYAADLGNKGESLKGFTAHELAEISRGDFTSHEIAGNLLLVNNPHLKSRYQQLGYGCPIQVTAKEENIQRRYVEIDQDGTIKPDSELIVNSKRNRYYIINK